MVRAFAILLTLLVPASAKAQQISLGVNLVAPAYYTYEQPFINNMLTAADWSCPNCKWRTQPTFDAQGYPINMAGNTQICTATLYNIPTTPTTDYLIKYTGDGIHPIAKAGTLAKIGFYEGSFVDTTPGRYIYRTTGQVGFCITSDDPDNTGNYIRNIAIINCGTTPRSCTNETRWDNCTQPNKTCLNPTWEVAFGTTHVGGPGFSSYRFMDWMATNGVSDGAWTDRSVASYFSYATTKQKTGVPLEVVFGVINQTCADGWINVPIAGIPIVTDGTFTGSISGTTLSTSGLSGSLTVGDYLKWNGIGSSSYGTHIVASLGSGQYTVSPSQTRSSIPMTASYVNTSYIQSMATLAQSNIVWCNGNQKLRVEVGNEPWNFTGLGYSYFGKLADSLWGIGGVDGGYNFRGMITAIAGNIFKATFSAQSEHIQAVLNVQPVVDTNYATAGNVLLTTPHWSGGPAYNHGIDAVALSMYYTIGEANIPFDWMSLPDGGLAKLGTEILSGGQVNNQMLSLTQSGGTGYTNGTYGYVPLRATSGTGVGALCQFVVTGGVPTCNYGKDLFNGGENYTVGDQLAIDTTSPACTQKICSAGSGWTGTVAKTSGRDSNTTGLLQSQIVAVVNSWQSYLKTYSLPIFAYEGGSQILANNGSSPFLGKGLICAYDSSPQAQQVTYQLLNTWRTLVGATATFNYYTDVGACGYPGSWGLLHGISDKTNKKYQGALQQLSAQPRPQPGVQRP